MVGDKNRLPRDVEVGATVDLLGAVERAANCLPYAASVRS